MAVELRMIQVIISEEAMANLGLTDPDVLTFPWRDASLPAEGDDQLVPPSDDDTLRARTERWLDLPAGTLGSREVFRPPGTGNIVIMESPVYG